MSTPFFSQRGLTEADNSSSRAPPLLKYIFVNYLKEINAGLITKMSIKSFWVALRRCMPHPNPHWLGSSSVNARVVSCFVMRIFVGIHGLLLVLLWGPEESTWCWDFDGPAFTFLFWRLTLSRCSRTQAGVICKLSRNCQSVNASGWSHTDLLVKLTSSWGARIIRWSITMLKCQCPGA